MSAAVLLLLCGKTRTLRATTGSSGESLVIFLTFNPNGTFQYAQSSPFASSFYFASPPLIIIPCPFQSPEDLSFVNELVDIFCLPAISKIKEIIKAGAANDASKSQR